MNSGCRDFFGQKMELRKAVKDIDQLNRMILQGSSNSENTLLPQNKCIEDQDIIGFLGQVSMGFKRAVFIFLYIKTI